MTREDVMRELISAIADNQELNGKKNSKILASTRPMSNLEMFSSLNAVEVLIDLEQRIEEKYGIQCELEVTLFFNQKPGGKITKEMTHSTLSVEQVAENIHNQILTRG